MPSSLEACRALDPSPTKIIRTQSVGLMNSRIAARRRLGRRSPPLARIAERANCADGPGGARRMPPSFRRSVLLPSLARDASRQYLHETPAAGQVPVVLPAAACCWARAGRGHSAALFGMRSKMRSMADGAKTSGDSARSIQSSSSNWNIRRASRSQSPNAAGKCLHCSASASPSKPSLPVYACKIRWWLRRA